MSDEREFDDVADELRATRAEPRPEFARDLDQRAAGWLGERPRRRLSWPRIAIPAVAVGAAAAIVIAIVVSGGGDDGGDTLDVAVVSEGALPRAAPPQGGVAPQTGAAPGEAAPDALQSPFEDRDSAAGAGGAFLLLTKEGDTVTVRYLFPAATDATVELAGREAEVAIEAGPGSLEISTSGLPAGDHELVITAPSTPTYRQRIQIGR